MTTTRHDPGAEPRPAARPCPPNRRQEIPACTSAPRRSPTRCTTCLPYPPRRRRDIKAQGIADASNAADGTRPPADDPRRGDGQTCPAMSAVESGARVGSSTRCWAMRSRQGPVGTAPRSKS